MIYKSLAFEDKEVPGQWRVESLNMKTGESEITIFCGVTPEQRAIEYAKWRNSPIEIPAPIQSGNPEAITIQVQDGHSVQLRLGGLSWSHDKKRGTVTARQKDIVESIG